MNPNAVAWTPPGAGSTPAAAEPDGSLQQQEAVARICSEVLIGLDDDTLEYVATSCVDDGQVLPKSELIEFVAPLLLDAEVCEEEDAAEALAGTLWDTLCAGTTGEDGATGGLVAAAEDTEPLLLNKRVIVAVDKAAQDARVAQGMTAMMDLVTDGGCVNSVIKVWNLDDPGGEAELTDKQLRELLKKRKKDEKRFAKDTRLEKASAERRNALIEALRTRPVVLHRDVTCSTIPDINLVGVSMELDAKILLEDVTCSIVSGRRYGLVGKNGTGKTTFLRHLAAKAFTDVEVLKELQIVHIEQEVEGDERSVLATVLGTDIERDSLMEEEADIQLLLKGFEPPGPGSKLEPQPEPEPEPEPELELSPAARAQAAQGRRLKTLAKKLSEEEEAELSARLGEIYDRLTEIDAHTAEARASRILAGLQFSEAMQARPTSTFSGGWRMRISLALALFIQPDVLLLDEPTNHLDLHAVIWLEDYLMSWSNTLIVVSHAREFLNEVCTDTLHLHDKTIKRYKNCNYDEFEQVRYDQELVAERAAESQDKQIAHMQKFIDKYRSNASKAGMAQSRIKALEKMQKVSRVRQDADVVLSFPKPDIIPGPLIQLIDVSFGYTVPPATKPEKVLFSNVNLTIDAESRIALVGPNGIGKSTLLKTIFGDHEPTTGHVQLNNKLRIGRFTQHHADQLDMQKTPLEMLQKVATTHAGQSVPITALRSHLGQMGLSGKLALQPIYTMSGGQKSRVSLALITWTKPQVMLLDEPTNHLDLETVSALIEALLDYTGGILVVSHDEHLITAVCDTLWIAGEGTVRQSKGDFQDYKQQCL